jgi:hypothetical protein
MEKGQCHHKTLKVVRTLNLPRDYQVYTEKAKPVRKISTGGVFMIKDRVLSARGVKFCFVWRGVVRSYAVLIGALHRARACALAKHVARQFQKYRTDRTSYNGSTVFWRTESEYAYISEPCLYSYVNAKRPRGVFQPVGAEFRHYRLRCDSPRTATQRCTHRPTLCYHAWGPRTDGVTGFMTAVLGSLVVTEDDGAIRTTKTVIVTCKRCRLARVHQEVSGEIGDVRRYDSDLSVSDG